MSLWSEMSYTLRDRRKLTLRRRSPCQNLVLNCTFGQDSRHSVFPSSSPLRVRLSVSIGPVSTWISSGRTCHASICTFLLVQHKFVEHHIVLRQPCRIDHEVFSDSMRAIDSSATIFKLTPFANDLAPIFHIVRKLQLSCISCMQHRGLMMS